MSQENVGAVNAAFDALARRGPMGCLPSAFCAFPFPAPVVTVAPVRELTR
jgi:hypothetical protein